MLGGALDILSAISISSLYSWTPALCTNICLLATPPMFSVLPIFSKLLSLNLPKPWLPDDSNILLTTAVSKASSAPSDINLDVSTLLL
jgi:hypothetical protein